MLRSHICEGSRLTGYQVIKRGARGSRGAPCSPGFGQTPALAIPRLTAACWRKAVGFHVLWGPASNNSFKPNLLRYTKSVAKKPATLLPPLRKSA
jgi:hypothetical protein